MEKLCNECGSPLIAISETCETCGFAQSASLPTVPHENDNPNKTLVHTPYHRFGAHTSDDGRVDIILQKIARQSHFEERYKISGSLASGGMGRILRAYDEVLKREVAIKVMHRRQTESDNNLRGQFLKEARIGGRLLHPNILPTFDLGVNSEGEIFFSMRLVDGASLHSCLDSISQGTSTKLIAFPLLRLVETFLGACEGIDFAHQNGVIHLDVKPQNILVSGFKEVFVIDWGLARLDDFDDTEKLIDIYRNSSSKVENDFSTGVFDEVAVGTPGFMSPEQSRGCVNEFNPTTDVFGLGGVLYFILYGVAPNRGKAIREILNSVVQPKKRGVLRNGIMPRGQRVRDDFRASVEKLEAICLKALDVNQEKRFQTVEEMIIEIKEWIANVPESMRGC